MPKLFSRSIAGRSCLEGMKRAKRFEVTSEEQKPGDRIFRPLAQALNCFGLDFPGFALIQVAQLQAQALLLNNGRVTGILDAVDVGEAFVTFTSAMETFTSAIESLAIEH